MFFYLTIHNYLVISWSLATIIHSQQIDKTCLLLAVWRKLSNFWLFLESNTNIGNTNTTMNKCECEYNFPMFIWLHPVALVNTGLKINCEYWWKTWTPVFARLIFYLILQNGHIYTWTGCVKARMLSCAGPLPWRCTKNAKMPRLEIKIEVRWDWVKWSINSDLCPKFPWNPNYNYIYIWKIRNIEI